MNQVPKKRRPFPLQLALFLTAFLLTINCNDRGNPVISHQEPVIIAYFDEVIQPILSANCEGSGCHISDTAADLDLSIGQAFENLVNVTSVNYSPAVRVVPGDLENSVMWNKLTNSGLYGGFMPLTGMLEPAEIDLITAWISDGALNTVIQ